MRVSYAMSTVSILQENNDAVTELHYGSQPGIMEANAINIAI